MWKLCKLKSLPLEDRRRRSKNSVCYYLLSILRFKTSHSSAFGFLSTYNETPPVGSSLYNKQITIMYLTCVRSRPRTSGPHSCCLLRIQIMVSETETHFISPPLTNSYTFLLIIEAIYLAKRNIRKKGILEMHEQVRTTVHESFILPTGIFSCVISYPIRNTITVFTSGWIINGIL